MASSVGGESLLMMMNIQKRHMVPTDQPEAALDMFVRWLNDVPLAFSPEYKEKALGPWSA